MAEEQASQLQMPPSAQKPTVPEPIIHVMPAEFRGGKMPMTPPPKPVEPPKPVAPPPPPKPLPPPPAPPQAGGVVKKLPPKKKKISPVLIVGLVFLVLIGGGAAYVLSTLNPPAPPVVEPEPEPEPTPECSATDPCAGNLVCEKGECVAPPAPVEPTGGTDSDSDGLSDIEEVLFGADPRDPDTDSDTYLDGNEVFHLYNPRGDAPGLLVDTGFAREFSEDGFSYTIVYPSRWTTQVLDGENEEVIFRVPTGEFVQVLKESKDPAMNIKAWYLAQAPGVQETDVGEVRTRQGYTGVTSPDKITTYLDFGGTVYVISYNLGDVSTINFLTTYQMMVNSFLIKE